MKTRPEFRAGFLLCKGAGKSLYLNQGLWICQGWRA
jgi:hypothetical protein